MITAYLSAALSFLKKHRWKTIISLTAVIVVGGGAYAALRPSKPQYITELSKRGDLLQTVEAVGTVISDRDLELQFRNMGIVSEVLVKEGDIVKAGQKLAALRSGDLSANVSGALARVKEAEASLATLKEGTRPEEIAVAAAQVENRKANLDIAKSTLKTAQANMDASQQKLESLKQEVSVNLSGQIDQAPLIANQNLTSAEQALASVNDILTKDNVVNTISREGLRVEQANIIDEQKKANATIQSLYNISFTGADYNQTIAILEQYKGGIKESYNVLTGAYQLIASLPESPNVLFYNSDKESYRNTLAGDRTSAQTALSNVDNWIQSFRGASAGYDTKISAEESAFKSAQGAKEKAEADIKNYETSIQIDEAQLALKKAGNRQSDIDAAEARLRAANAELAGTNANLSDTVLSAPTNGRITKVDIKVGEITPTGPAVAMLGESPYRIEVFDSEIDIPKVKYDQQATIELDAFPGVQYKMRVGEIDEAQSLIDGVAKYRVKLDFVFPHDEFKLGMTGDTTIVTDQRKNVVFIPARAVLEDGQRKYVRVLSGDGTVVEKDVETGMEGAGGDLEISKGLDAGENVIILVK